MLGARDSENTSESSEYQTINIPIFRLKWKYFTATYESLLCVHNHIAIIFLFRLLCASEKLNFLLLTSEDLKLNQVSMALETHCIAN
jgi:hypothetical protein